MFFLRELKNLNFGGYSRRVNQSGACSSSDVITSGGRKSETTMEDKVIVVVCGYPELYIHLRTFTKTGIHFATRLELPGRSPSHDANSRMLCSEFLVHMKRVNSKCSSVQLRANSAIYSRHSHLVWTHLKTPTEVLLDRWHCRKCAFTNVAYVDTNMERIFEFNNLSFSPEMFCHLSVIKDDCYGCFFLPEHLQCEWTETKVDAESPALCSLLML